MAMSRAQANMQNLARAANSNRTLSDIMASVGIPTAMLPSAAAAAKKAAEIIKKQKKKAEEDKKKANAAAKNLITGGGSLGVSVASGVRAGIVPTTVMSESWNKKNNPTGAVYLEPKLTTASQHTAFKSDAKKYKLPFEKTIMRPASFWPAFQQWDKASVFNVSLPWYLKDSGGRLLRPDKIKQSDEQYRSARAARWRSTWHGMTGEDLPQEIEDELAARFAADDADDYVDDLVKAYQQLGYNANSFRTLISKSAAASGRLASLKRMTDVSASLTMDKLFRTAEDIRREEAERSLSATHPLWIDRFGRRVEGESELRSKLDHQFMKYRLMIEDASIEYATIDTDSSSVRTLLENPGVTNSEARDAIWNELERLYAGKTLSVQEEAHIKNQVNDLIDARNRFINESVKKDGIDSQREAAIEARLQEDAEVASERAQQDFLQETPDIKAWYRANRITQSEKEGMMEDLEGTLPPWLRSVIKQAGKMDYRKGNEYLETVYGWIKDMDADASGGKVIIPIKEGRQVAVPLLNMQINGFRDYIELKEGKAYNEVSAPYDLSTKEELEGQLGMSVGEAQYARVTDDQLRQIIRNVKEGTPLDFKYVKVNGIAYDSERLLALMKVSHPSGILSADEIGPFYVRIYEEVHGKPYDKWDGMLMPYRKAELAYALAAQVNPYSSMENAMKSLKYYNNKDYTGKPAIMSSETKLLRSKLDYDTKLAIWASAHGMYYNPEEMEKLDELAVRQAFNRALFVSKQDDPEAYAIAQWRKQHDYFYKLNYGKEDEVQLTGQELMQDAKLYARVHDKEALPAILDLNKVYTVTLGMDVGSQYDFYKYRGVLSTKITDDDPYYADTPFEAIVTGRPMLHNAYGGGLSDAVSVMDVLLQPTLRAIRRSEAKMGIEAGSSQSWFSKEYGYTTESGEYLSTQRTSAGFLGDMMFDPINWVDIPLGLVAGAARNTYRQTAKEIAKQSSVLRRGLMNATDAAGRQAAFDEYLRFFDMNHVDTAVTASYRLAPDKDSVLRKLRDIAETDPDAFARDAMRITDKSYNAKVMAATLTDAGLNWTALAMFSAGAIPAALSNPDFTAGDAAALLIALGIGAFAGVKTGKIRRPKWQEKVVMENLAKAEQAEMIMATSLLTREVMARAKQGPFDRDGVVQEVVLPAGATDAMQRRVDFFNSAFADKGRRERVANLRERFTGAGQMNKERTLFQYIDSMAPTVNNDFAAVGMTDAVLDKVFKALEDNPNMHLRDLKRMADEEYSRLSRMDETMQMTNDQLENYNVLREMIDDVQSLDEMRDLADQIVDFANYFDVPITSIRRRVARKIERLVDLDARARADDLAAATDEIDGIITRRKKGARNDRFQASKQRQAPNGYTVTDLSRLFGFNVDRFTDDLKNALLWADGPLVRALTDILTLVGGDIRVSLVENALIAAWERAGRNATVREVLDSLGHEVKTMLGSQGELLRSSGWYGRAEALARAGKVSRVSKAEDTLSQFTSDIWDQLDLRVGLANDEFEIELPDGRGAGVVAQGVLVRESVMARAGMNGGDKFNTRFLDKGITYTVPDNLMPDGVDFIVARSTVMGHSSPLEFGETLGRSGTLEIKAVPRGVITTDIHIADYGVSGVVVPASPSVIDVNGNPVDNLPNYTYLVQSLRRLNLPNSIMDRFVYRAFGESPYGHALMEAERMRRDPSQGAGWAMPNGRIVPEIPLEYRQVDIDPGNPVNNVSELAKLHIELDLAINTGNNVLIDNLAVKYTNKVIELSAHGSDEKAWDLPAKTVTGGYKGRLRVDTKLAPGFIKMNRQDMRELGLAIGGTPDVVMIYRDPAIRSSSVEAVKVLPHDLPNREVYLPVSSLYGKNADQDGDAINVLADWNKSQQKSLWSRLSVEGRMNRPWISDVLSGVNMDANSRTETANLARAFGIDVGAYGDLPSLRAAITEAFEANDIPDATLARILLAADKAISPEEVSADAVAAIINMRIRPEAEYAEAKRAATAETAMGLAITQTAGYFYKMILYKASLDSDAQRYAEAIFAEIMQNGINSLKRAGGMTIEDLVSDFSVVLHAVRTDDFSRFDQALRRLMPDNATRVNERDIRHLYDTLRRTDDPRMQFTRERDQFLFDNGLYTVEAQSDPFMPNARSGENTDGIYVPKNSTRGNIPLIKAQPYKDELDKELVDATIPGTLDSTRNSIFTLLSLMGIKNVNMGERLLAGTENEAVAYMRNTLHRTDYDHLYEMGGVWYLIPEGIGDQAATMRDLLHLPNAGRGVMGTGMDADELIDALEARYFQMLDNLPPEYRSYRDAIVREENGVYRFQWQNDEQRITGERVYSDSWKNTYDRAEKLRKSGKIDREMHDLEREFDAWAAQNQGDKFVMFMQHIRRQLEGGSDRHAFRKLLYAVQTRMPGETINRGNMVNAFTNMVLPQYERATYSGVGEEFGDALTFRQAFGSGSADYTIYYERLDANTIGYMEVLSQGSATPIRILVDIPDYRQLQPNLPPWVYDKYMRDIGQVRRIDFQRIVRAKFQGRMRNATGLHVVASPDEIMPLLMRLGVNVEGCVIATSGDRLLRETMLGSDFMPAEIIPMIDRNANMQYTRTQNFIDDVNYIESAFLEFIRDNGDVTIPDNLYQLAANQRATPTSITVGGLYPPSAGNQGLYGMGTRPLPNIRYADAAVIDDIPDGHKVRRERTSWRVKDRLLAILSRGSPADFNANLLESFEFLERMGRDYLRRNGLSDAQLDQLWAMATGRAIHSSVWLKQLKWFNSEAVGIEALKPERWARAANDAKRDFLTLKRDNLRQAIDFTERYLAGEQYLSEGDRIYITAARAQLAVYKKNLSAINGTLRRRTYNTYSKLNINSREAREAIAAETATARALRETYAKLNEAIMRAKKIHDGSNPVLRRMLEDEAKRLYEGALWFSNSVLADGSPLLMLQKFDRIPPATYSKYARNDDFVVTYADIAYRELLGDISSVSTMNDLILPQIKSGSVKAHMDELMDNYPTYYDSNGAVSFVSPQAREYLKQSQHVARGILRDNVRKFGEYFFNGDASVHDFLDLMVLRHEHHVALPKSAVPLAYIDKLRKLDYVNVVDQGGRWHVILENASISEGTYRKASELVMTAQAKPLKSMQHRITYGNGAGSHYPAKRTQEWLRRHPVLNVEKGSKGPPDGMHEMMEKTAKLYNELSERQFIGAELYIHLDKDAAEAFLRSLGAYAADVADDVTAPHMLNSMFNHGLAAKHSVTGQAPSLEGLLIGHIAKAQKASVPLAAINEAMPDLQMRQVFANENGVVPVEELWQLYHTQKVTRSGGMVLVRFDDAVSTRPGEGFATATTTGRRVVIVTARTRDQFAKAVDRGYAMLPYNIAHELQAMFNNPWYYNYNIMWGVSKVLTVMKLLLISNPMTYVRNLVETFLKGFVSSKEMGLEGSVMKDFAVSFMEIERLRKPMNDYKKFLKDMKLDSSVDSVRMFRDAGNSLGGLSPEEFRLTYAADIIRTGNVTKIGLFGYLGYPMGFIEDAGRYMLFKKMATSMEYTDAAMRANLDRVFFKPGAKTTVDGAIGNLFFKFYSFRMQAMAYWFNVLMKHTPLYTNAVRMYNDYLTDYVYDRLGPESTSERRYKSKQFLEQVAAMPIWGTKYSANLLLPFMEIINDVLHPGSRLENTPWIMGWLGLNLSGELKDELTARTVMRNMVPQQTIELLHQLAKLTLGDDNPVTKFLFKEASGNKSQGQAELFRLTGTPAFVTEPYDRMTKDYSFYPKRDPGTYVYTTSYRKQLYDYLYGDEDFSSRWRNFGRRGWDKWLRWDKNNYPPYHRKAYYRHTYARKSYANMAYLSAATKLRVPYARYPGLYRMGNAYWPYTTPWGFNPTGSPSTKMHVRHSHQFNAQRKILRGDYGLYSKYRDWMHGYVQPTRRRESKYYPHWQHSALWMLEHKYMPWQKTSTSAGMYTGRWRMKHSLPWH